MKFAVLGYNDTRNLGDSIQTMAVLQHVAQDYIIIDRDHLSDYSGEPCILVMNGWFSHQPQNWPPAEAITPIFFGFHMTPDAAREYAVHKDYFKRNEPIGCRDRGTADIILSWGVDAYVSGCATMTFPERSGVPANGKVIAVDVPRGIFKRRDRKSFMHITQASHVDYTSNKTRNQIASELLSFYKNNAKTVITSRIHCAMPCYAMGIPVVYCGVKEYRTKLIDEIGVPSLNIPKFRRLTYDDVMFKSPDFEAKKISIATKLRELLTSHGVSVKAWSSKESHSTAF